MDADRLLRSDCADVDCWIGGPEGRPFLLSCVTSVWEVHEFFLREEPQLLCVLFKCSSHFVFEEILFS